MKRAYYYIGFIASVAMVVSGCTVSSKDTLIVTQPMGDVVDKVEQLINKEDGSTLYKNESPSSLAIIPFDNDTDEEIAPKLLRRVVQNHLSGLNFRMIHPDDVERKMPKGATDPTKLASYFGVEGVLVGRVTEYSRFYAGIYAQNTLGVSLALYNVKGEKVWETEQSVTQRAGGVSTTAWGILLNAAIAAMRLDDESLLAVADELGRKIARAMPQPSSNFTGEGPSIEQVIHDKPGLSVKYGDVIKVGIKGQEDAQASASLGKLLTVELEQVEPGVYVGEIPVEPEWTDQRVPIRGHLRNDLGQTTTLISSVGLVDFDSIPPEPVTEIAGSLTPETLKLSWSAGEGATSYKVVVGNNGEVANEFVTADTYLTANLSVPVFERRTVTIYSLDEAKNLSESSNINLTSYPQDVGKQVYLSGPLQGDYQGINILTKLFSPYQVKGNVTFDAASELYVEPGVELQFDPNAIIHIKGDGNFWGNVESPITLNANGDTARKVTFLAINTDNAVQITGTKFLNGGMGVEITKGAMTLDVVDFVGTRFSAISASGESQVKVSQCLIDGSNTSGIVVSEFAQVSINDCTLRNNRPFHIQNASNYEVDARNNIWEPEASASMVLGQVRTK